MASWFETLKSDAVSATYRVAGTQIILGAKNGLLKVLQKRGVNNKHLNSVSEFLDTEVGGALLSTAVGVALPLVKPGKMTNNIAKEFRVGGLSVLGNMLVERTVGDVVPVVKSIMGAFPKSNIAFPTKKFRVAALEDASSRELEEENSTYNPRQLVMSNPK